VERGSLQGWRAHGPGSSVKGASRWGKHERFGPGRGCVLGERLCKCGNRGGLREQGTDVATAEGNFSGTQAPRVRCAQGREQEEKADEMAVPQTHVLFILNEMRKKLDVGMKIRWVSRGEPARAA